MDELKSQASQLSAEINDAAKQLGLEKLEKELAELSSEAAQPDFWTDTSRAQRLTKRQADLTNRLKPWQEAMSEINEIQEMLQLNDQALMSELQANLQGLTEKISVLKSELKLAGPYADHDAVLAIYAGAGGTDAQDWTAMLHRMYTRYAERAGFKITLIDESAGEEAGLKSIMLEVSGPYAYGKLRSEHGVHRLVRLSPFNSDNLRQTSFAKVEIAPKIDQPEELEIDEKDLKIDVYRSGGKGGQSVNTTDSAVRITHIPTGITVAIQNERSQLQNKETAMGILRSRLAQLQLEQHAESVSKLKGPNQSAEWGNQIRSYVLHPYKMVKDLRTNHETSDTEAVLDGDLQPFVEAYLEKNLGK